jgi:hypothetical protein
VEADDLFEEEKILFVEGELGKNIETLTKAVGTGYESKISCLSRGATHLKLWEVDKAIADFGR